MGLTKAQVARLSKAIDPSHVEKKQGLSYMAQHEVRAELTRIFGYGNWDSQVESMDLLYETMLEPGHPQYPQKGNGKPYYVVAYRASVRLNIRDYDGKHVASFVEYHAEENAPLPNRGEAHAMAITSVESYALRRAALGLGDRLGLGLYNNGQITPLVKGTLQIIDEDSPQYTKREEGPAQPTAAPRTASVDRLQAVVKGGEGA